MTCTKLMQQLYTQRRNLRNCLGQGTSRAYLALTENNDNGVTTWQTSSAAVTKTANPTPAQTCAVHNHTAQLRRVVSNRTTMLPDIVRSLHCKDVAFTTGQVEGAWPLRAERLFLYSAGTECLWTQLQYVTATRTSVLCAAYCQGAITGTGRTDRLSSTQNKRKKIREQKIRNQKSNYS
jgi:hypothetical protein